MNISPVSFRAISTDPTQKLMDDVINKQHAFLNTDNPAGATSVEEDKPKKGKAGKVLALLAAAAGSVALCAWGAKTGRLTPVEDGNKFVNHAKKILGTIGEKVLTIFSKKGAEVAEEVVEKGA